MRMFHRPAIAHRLTPPNLELLTHGLPLALDRGSFRLDPRLAAHSRRPRIRCPACNWQPGRNSTWCCVSAGHPEYFSGGCGHAWNTFDTRGRCPTCRYQWLYTSCLSCGIWSLHEDWYERESDTPTAGSAP